MHALIKQVLTAANGGNEQGVVTVITKPMWQAFLRATGGNPKQKPTKMLGVGNTFRVYGSHTIVVESTQMKSFSFKVEPA